VFFVFCSLPVAEQRWSVTRETRITYGLEFIKKRGASRQTESTSCLHALCNSRLLHNMKLPTVGRCLDFSRRRFLNFGVYLKLKGPGPSHLGTIIIKNQIQNLELVSKPNNILHQYCLDNIRNYFHPVLCTSLPNHDTCRAHLQKAEHQV
jgi:hypothetical protein